MKSDQELVPTYPVEDSAIITKNPLKPCWGTMLVVLTQKTVPPSEPAIPLQTELEFSYPNSDPDKKEYHKVPTHDDLAAD